MPTMTQEIPVDARNKLKLIESEADKLAGFKIVTATEYTQSIELLKRVKCYADEIDKTRKGITKPLDEAKKNVMEFFSPILERLSVIERSIKDGALAFQREQQRIQAEAQAKAFAAAQAEEARQRKIKEDQERQWREKEAAALAEAAKLAAAGRADEAAKAEEAALKASQKAQERAEQAQAIQVMAPVIEVATPVVSGISKRKTWYATITDVKAIPVEYYLSDEKVIEAIGKVLNKFATATKGGVQVPGVKFNWTEDIASGKA